MSESGTGIVIKYENKGAMDVLDFTASLAAIADEFSRYDESDARLVIDRIENGSIIAFLMANPSALTLGSFALKSVAPFVGNFEGVLNAIADLSESSRRLDSATVKNARAFVRPAANNGGIAFGDNTSIGTLNYINITPDKAARIANNADHLLAAPFPSEHRFTEQPLALYQVRDAKKGDIGFIDAFDAKPRKLTFANDNIKNAIAHFDGNPFEVLFFVSGIARTAGGKIASYHITDLHSVEPRDAD